MKKIAVITGSRADYGLLSSTLKELRSRKSFETLLVATGSHLDADFGATISEIKKDGFEPIVTANILSSEGHALTTNESVSMAIQEFDKIYRKQKPDIILVLGDRFEIFAACIAATFLNIPIAHLHGGELTASAVDDALRHSITKMSHWHFVSAEAYRSRVIQLGEHPDRVWVVGATAVDGVGSANLSRAVLEDILKVKWVEPVFTVTIHPETLRPELTKELVQCTLAAIRQCEPGTVIFTKANADAQGRVVNRLIQSELSHFKNTAFVDSLGHKGYLSLLKHSDVVIGNSSSGMIEAPIIGIPSVNVGDRQKGRLRTPSILDVEIETSKIVNVIRQSLMIEFKKSAKEQKAVFGEPGVAKRICDRLDQLMWPKNLIKDFYEKLA